MQVPKCLEVLEKVCSRKQQAGAFSFGPRVSISQYGFIVSSFLYKPPEDTLAVCAAVYTIDAAGIQLIANVLVNASKWVYLLCEYL